jgi:hypothetical protein
VRVAFGLRRESVRFQTLECETVTGRPQKVQARLTNRLRESPHGLNGNTERGRRWRDLLELAIAEFGEGYPDKLREIATLKFSLEAAQAEVFAGDIAQSENVVRLSNLISRREKEMRAKARQREAERPAIGPREHFARKAAKAFSEPAGGHREDDR